MSKVAVFYGSTTGNTEFVAGKIAMMLDADKYDVAHKPDDKFAEYDILILGTSTYGFGGLQDDWDSFIPDLRQADLSHKVIALFALGDSQSYPDSFTSSMSELYNVIKDKGCRVIGFTDASDYEYDESESVIDGKFVGLPIDEDNESDKTDQRISKWIDALRDEI